MPRDAGVRPAVDKIYLGTYGHSYGNSTGPRFGGEIPGKEGYGPCTRAGSGVSLSVRDLSLCEIPMAYYGKDLWLAMEDQRIDQLRAACGIEPRRNPAVETELAGAPAGASLVGQTLAVSFPPPAAPGSGTVTAGSAGGGGAVRCTIAGARTGPDAVLHYRLLLRLPASPAAAHPSCWAALQLEGTGPAVAQDVLWDAPACSKGGASGRHGGQGRSEMTAGVVVAGGPTVHDFAAAGERYWKDRIAGLPQ